MNQGGERWLLVLGLLLVVCGCRTVPRGTAPTAPLRFPQDTFAFANETVLAYQDGRVVAETELRTERAPRRYTRSCFVMARGVIQFWKFARFVPDAPPLPEAELGRRIGRLAHRAPWDESAATDQRVVIPGYSDLHQFSAAHPAVLQANLGSGWATYFRVGNWSMPFTPNRRHQVATRAMIDEHLDRGLPAVLWLANFPRVSINHVVVVFDRQAEPAGMAYRVYDPNYTDRPRTLRYDVDQKTFFYEPTFYFVGGAVNVRVIYQNVLQ